MQVEDYCKAMQAEVNAWKEKLEAMKKTADSFGTEQKEKVLPLIGQLEQEVVAAKMRVNSSRTSALPTGRHSKTNSMTFSERLGVNSTVPFLMCHPERCSGRNDWGRVHALPHRPITW